jgi:lactate dehydrogenase-like 2-hydroxyacid dehydrogenase
MLLLLACSRRATEAERMAREGRWKKEFESLIGNDPRGKTLGIVGMVPYR